MDKESTKFCNQQFEKSNKFSIKNEKLPEFLTEEITEFVPALKGFAADEVIITNFSSQNNSDWLVHHPILFKIVVCDEYPSYCYGDFVDPETSLII